MTGTTKQTNQELINEFLNEVFEKYDKQNLTDKIFCFIENDKDLLQKYIALMVSLNIKPCTTEELAKYSDFRSVHSQMSKLIAKHYEMKYSQESFEPKSKLLYGPLAELVKKD